MDDRYKSLLIVSFSFLISFLFVHQASSAVRLVHTPGSSACSISEIPDDTYTSIQNAIDAANHGDVIRVCAGTYNERIDFNGKRVNLVSVSGRDTTIIDAGTNDTSMQNRAVVTFNSGEGSYSILDGFTLTNGKGFATNEGFTCVGGNQCSNPTPDAQGNCDGACVNFGGACYVGGDAMLPHRRGGGIYCSGTSPRIRNCKIEGNDAHYGGGMYMDFASPTIENCIIGGDDRDTESNSSNPFSAVGDEILTNIINAAGCSPEDVSYGGEGGGIYLWHSSGTTIKDNTISNNVSKNGGAGIYMYFSSPEIDNNDIVDNRSYWGGGGIQCDKSSPTITNNRLLRNIARDDGTQSGTSSNSNNNPGGMRGGGTGKGGGILCWASSFPTISDCDISYNGATYGGGIHCDESDPTIKDCTITHNSAWNIGRINGTTGMVDAVFAYGGGVYTYRSSPAFTRCNISSNFASVAGGGIYSENYVDYSGDTSLMPPAGLPIPQLISPELYKCTISFNGAGVVPTDLGQSGGEAAVPGIQGYGGGIACQYGCSMQIKNSIIASNLVSGYGGGIATGEYYEPCTGDNPSAPCWDDSGPSTNPSGWDPPDLPISEPTITNCTIANNEKEGIMADNNSRPGVVNTIIWGNVKSFSSGDSLDGSRQIDHRNNPDVSPLSYWYNDYTVTPNIIKDVPRGSLTSSYSNIEGGAIGVGNIDSDPLFVDGAGGNYTLQYLPLNVPPIISPSIDTAHPDTTLTDDIDGAPRPVDIDNGPPQSYAFDMGAYERCTVLSTFYKDVDGDTFGDPSISISKCVAPRGYVSNGDDCDDTDENVNPNSMWYLDVDGDGYVDENLANHAVSQCSNPGSDYYVENAPHMKSLEGDCDDSNAELNPETLWYVDADADGYPSGDNLQQCIDPGSTYFLEIELISTEVDCIDDPSVDSNAGLINPGTYWFRDADGDGYSDGTRSDATCVRPDGYFLLAELDPIAPSGDCDDNDAVANPGTLWYLDADRDGYTDTRLPDYVVAQCAYPGIGYYREDSTHIISTSGDCDDSDPAVVGIDWYLDADGDGYADENSPIISACSNTTADYYIEADLQAITGDCNDNASDPFSVHMNPASVWYLDADADGYGSDQIGSQIAGVCDSPGVGYHLAFEFVAGRTITDCNDDPTDDYSRWVNPGQPEVCNNPDIDDNCDGELAGGYTPEKVISNDSVISDPDMSESKIVWSQHDGTSNKVRVYNIADEGIIYLSGGVNGANSPSISENGNIAWNETLSVFLYREGGSVTNIYNAVVVGGEEIINYVDVNDNGDVSWEFFGGYDENTFEEIYDVYLKPYSVTARKVTGVSHTMKLSPKVIGSGNVVFSNRQVYLHSALPATTAQLSVNFDSAKGADMNESGKVVWYGKEISGDNDEIYLYDPSDNSITPLTTTENPIINSAPKINNVGDVVWQAWNGSNVEIYVRYAGTSTNIRVTDNAYNDSNPGISDDGTMVWQAWFDGDTEVFICKGDNPPLPSALPNEMCDGGNIPFRTDNAVNDSSPTINTVGDVAWKRSVSFMENKICLKRFISCVAGNTYYKDIDGDGLGDSARYIEIADTNLPSGYSLTGGDCNDNDGSVLGAIDWYVDADGDTYGEAGSSPLNSCQQPLGYVSNDGDCDDTDPLEYQGCGASPKISVSQGDYIDGYFVLDIPSIQSEGSNGVISEASIRIKATVNIDGIVRAFLYYGSQADGRLTKILMTHDGDGIFFGDIPIDTSSGTIRYYIIAEDSNGNKVDSKSDEFSEVPAQTPTMGEWGIVFLASMFLVATYKKLSFNNC